MLLKWVFEVIQLEIGDIVLVKGEDCLSEVIEDIQGSIYSHAAVIVKENEIIEARGFEATGYDGLDKYKGQADIFTCDSLNDKQREGIVKYIENEVGGHYDFVLLFLEFIRYVFHIILPYKKPFHSHICSTLCSDAYRSVGVDLCPGIKYPSPKDLSESKLLRKAKSIWWKIVKGHKTKRIIKEKVLSNYINSDYNQL